MTPVRKARRGFSLIEMVLVLTMAAILATMSVPSFRRASEQARADIAAANLRAIWTAEQFYWLENRQYTTDFSQLQGLVDPAIIAGSTTYVYALATADSSTFAATATRSAGSQWVGQLTIDQTGTITGSIQAFGQASIVPGFQ